MPVRTFWSFAKNINRIRAEEDLRQMDVAMSVQSGDAAEKVRAKLVEELGTPAKVPPKPVNHTEGVNFLKALGGKVGQG